MKILLERLDDRSFLGENNLWVSREAARDFKDTTSALFYARTLELRVRIRLAFDNHAYDLTLNIPYENQQTTKSTHAIHPVTSNVLI